MSFEMKGGDLPGLKTLIERMNGANRSVLVGVPVGSADEEDGTPMAVVAAANEFGSPEHNIPERSFLRGGIERGKPKFNKINIDSLRKVLLGKMTIEQAVEKLGVMAAGEVKREFVVGTFAPNKPATITRKLRGKVSGKRLKKVLAMEPSETTSISRPLIDTGALRQSITYIVEGASNAR